MAIGTVFLIVIVLIALAFAVPSVVAYVGGSDKRAELREARAEAALEKKRAQIATKGLRVIRDGAALPITEAEYYLCEVEKTYETKEISS
jgi:type II secretory pathway pseudopilin PulG